MLIADRDALVPDPLASDRQYNQFYHLDLPELDDMELTDEFHALCPLLWGLPPDHWLRERVAKLEGEMRKRKYDSGTETSVQRKQKVKPAEGVKL